MILRNSKGETLIETLVAILILTVVITGFSKIIATTAKVNSQVKQQRIVISDPSDDSTTVSVKSGYSVRVKETNQQYDVKVYYDEISGLYYYESDNAKFKKIENE